MNEEKGKNGNKWSELYKMAERKKDRQNRNKDEIEFAKNPEEFTFQPNAHKVRAAIRKNMSPKVQRKEKESTLEIATKGAKTQRDRSLPTTLRGGS